MIKYSIISQLILALFILSSCESDEKMFARVFVPIIIVGLLALVLNPILKRSKEKRSNQLNEEINKIKSQNTSVELNSDSAKSTPHSEFIFTAAIKKSTFVLVSVLLCFGLVFSFYTIFMLDTLIIFVFFLFSLITWMLCRSLIVTETKAII